MIPEKNKKTVYALAVVIFLVAIALGLVAAYNFSVEATDTAVAQLMGSITTFIMGFGYLFVLKRASGVAKKD